MKRVVRWGRSAYERDADLDDEAQRLGALGFDWVHCPSTEPPFELLEDAEALVVTSGVRVTPDVLERLRGPFVLTTTSGFDHVWVNDARRMSKKMARLAGVRRDSVVETALGAVIQLLRCHPKQYAFARRGVWARGELPAIAPRGLAGATVAVIGMGVIGRRMSQILHSMGAKVIGVDPAGVPSGITSTDLNTALLRADVVTLHCCLTADNRQMIDARALALMKPHAVLVNTARGPLLDVRAAADRVASGYLRGLAIDVFPEEPYPELAGLAAIEGVLLTPHAAGYTHDLGRRVADGVVKAFEAWSQGGVPEYPL